MFQKNIAIILMMLALFLLSGVVGAAEGNATEEVMAGEEELKIISSGRQLEDENISGSCCLSDDKLQSKGSFVDVSDAYGYLNEFRTGAGAWYWNEDDTTKTFFNTNESNRLEPLIRDGDLEKAAKKRAEEIVSLFSHTRPDGSRCFTIYPDDLRAAGENIAYGQATCFEVTEAWKEDNDPYAGQGHRRNMLSSMFNCVGIAGFKLNGIIYWVQAFGYDSTPNPVAEVQKPISNPLKSTPKLSAKNKFFKAKTKVKKHAITLKSGKNPIPNVAVTLKIKGKIFRATTNAKGKATFKIKKFTRKGTHNAVIHFKGNAHHKPVSKTVKIKIK